MQKQTHPSMPAFDCSEMMWALQFLQLPKGFPCVANDEVMLICGWRETAGVMGRNRELSQKTVLSDQRAPRWLGGSSEETGV